MSVSAATTAGALHWGNAHRHFLAHVLRMPAWHKGVIVVASLLAALGAVGTVAGKAAAVSESHGAPAPGADVRPAHSGGFVGQGSAASSDASGASSDDGLLARVSPHMMGVGVSVVAGFVLGWLLRAFLKTMALVALVLGVGLWALQHFGVVHLSRADYDAVRERSAEAQHWLVAAGSHVKAVVLAHLPSSGGGAFGAFLGFRRR